MSEPARALVVMAIALAAAAGTAQPVASRVGPNAALDAPIRACFPGATFAACAAALDAAHAPGIEGAHDGPTRRAVALRGAWVALDVIADGAGTVTQLRFSGTHRAGPARRRLLAFFDHALAGRPRGDAPPAGGCTGLGVAWFDDDAGRTAHRPRLELTIAPAATLQQTGWPGERVFVEASAPDQELLLCLIGSGTAAPDPFAAALARYLASPSF